MNNETIFKHAQNLWNLAQPLMAEINILNERAKASTHHHYIFWCTAYAREFEWSSSVNDPLLLVARIEAHESVHGCQVYKMISEN